MAFVQLYLFSIGFHIRVKVQFIFSFHQFILRFAFRRKEDWPAEKRQRELVLRSFADLINHLPFIFSLTN
tara:strand:- start:74 stop:283 length:210 start_codon:yes stop_codon:yes gene_type:complete